jgi:hypothetical protein
MQPPRLAPHTVFTIRWPIMADQVVEGHEDFWHNSGALAWLSLEVSSYAPLSTSKARLLVVTSP